MIIMNKKMIRSNSSSRVGYYFAHRHRLKVACSSSNVYVRINIVICCVLFFSVLFFVLY